MSETGRVYPSPIALTNKAIKRTRDSSLLYVGHVQSYTYNPDNKTYVVQDEVPLENNQLSYLLKEFHFHQPGEHTQLGQTFPIELHFVFADQDGNTLVLAFEALKACDSSPLFTSIINNKSFTIPCIRTSWNYPGSLTQLPADDNIEWIVADQVRDKRQILYISQEDLTALAPRSKSARPVQPRDGRDIIRVCQGWKVTRPSVIPVPPKVQPSPVPVPKVLPPSSTPSAPEPVGQPLLSVNTRPSFGFLSWLDAFNPCMSVSTSKKA